MKSLAKIIVAAALFFSTNVMAQLKLEGKADFKYKTIQLDNGTHKYLNYNQKEQSVLIYNLDNTVWRTITLPLPKNHYLDEIKHISQYIFNKDGLLELIYTCAELEFDDNYENAEHEYDQVNFTLNVINEAGQQLLKIPNSNSMELIISDTERKLLIYKHIEKHFKGKYETLVYTF